MSKINYQRYDGESDEELIYRICREKEQIGSWKDVADILNELLHTEYTESKFRKQYQAFEKMFNANQKLFTSTDAQAEEIKDLTRELKREQIRFRDERNAWNKQNYIDARIEQKMDYLEEQLSTLGKQIFSPTVADFKDGDTDLIVCASDWHIGETFNTAFGKYDSDIAKDRVEQLLREIIHIGCMNNSRNVYLVVLGDNISGNIHLSIQVSNRENVIEQVKLSAEMLVNFAYELSKYFEHVFIAGCAGNHSRLISEKEKDIKDERFDDLIIWIIEQMTKHMENITVLHRNLDNGIVDLKVRGKTYIGVHGDYDSMNSNSVGKLCMMLGFMPDYILGGHRHTPAYQEFNGVTYVQSGSLAGAGDDYTISKRLSGKACQTILVCNELGVDSIHNVKLL